MIAFSWFTSVVSASMSLLSSLSPNPSASYRLLSIAACKLDACVSSSNAVRAYTCASCAPACASCRSCCTDSLCLITLSSCIWARRSCGSASTLACASATCSFALSRSCCWLSTSLWAILASASGSTSPTPIALRLEYTKSLMRVSISPTASMKPSNISLNLASISNESRNFSTPSKPNTPATQLTKSLISSSGIVMNPLINSLAVFFTVISNFSKNPISSLNSPNEVKIPFTVAMIAVIGTAILDARANTFPNNDPKRPNILPILESIPPPWPPPSAFTASMIGLMSNTDAIDAPIVFRTLPTLVSTLPILFSVKNDVITLPALTIPCGILGFGSPSRNILICLIDPEAKLLMAFGIALRAFAIPSASLGSNLPKVITFIKLLMIPTA